LNPRALDFFRLRFVDFVIRLAERFAGFRMLHILKQRAAKNDLRKRNDDFTGTDNRFHGDAVFRAAVRLAHDAVLRNIDETARQIA
jgi:hypothetical protein